MQKRNGCYIIERVKCTGGPRTCPGMSGPQTRKTCLGV